MASRTSWLFIIHKISMLIIRYKSILPADTKWHSIFTTLGGLYVVIRNLSGIRSRGQKFTEGQVLYERSWPSPSIHRHQYSEEPYSQTDHSRLEGLYQVLRRNIWLWWFKFCLHSYGTIVSIVSSSQQLPSFPLWLKAISIKDWQTDVCHDLYPPRFSLHYVLLG